MKEFRYVIKDANGIHARPAAQLVKMAMKYQSLIKIKVNQKEVNAKQLFGIMSLGARCGDEIEIKAEGEDEQEAIQAMEEFLANNL